MSDGEFYIRSAFLNGCFSELGFLGVVAGKFSWGRRLELGCLKVIMFLTKLRLSTVVRTVALRS